MHDAVVTTQVHANDLTWASAAHAPSCALYQHTLAAVCWQQWAQQGWKKGIFGVVDELAHCGAAGRRAGAARLASAWGAVVLLGTDEFRRPGTNSVGGHAHSSLLFMMGQVPNDPTHACKRALLGAESSRRTPACCQLDYAHRALLSWLHQASSLMCRAPARKCCASTVGCSVRAHSYSCKVQAFNSFTARCIQTMHEWSASQARVGCSDAGVLRLVDMSGH